MAGGPQLKRWSLCGIHHRLSMTTAIKSESALSAAMANGVTDHGWTIEEMRAMLHGSAPIA